MVSIYTILSIVHLIGLGLGVGAATVKLMLLLKSNSNYDFVSIYLKVTRPITKIIITGLILLTLSGIGWILLGTAFTPLFIFKLILVFAVWVIGPVIDNVIEPKYIKLAPIQGEKSSPEFILIHKKLLLAESIATGLFYVITIIGVLL